MEYKVYVRDYYDRYAYHEVDKEVYEYIEQLERAVKTGNAGTLKAIYPGTFYEAKG